MILHRSYTDFCNWILMEIIVVILIYKYCLNCFTNKYNLSKQVQTRQNMVAEKTVHLNYISMTSSDDNTNTHNPG